MWPSPCECFSTQEMLQDSCWFVFFTPGFRYSSPEEEMRVKKLGNQVLCLGGPLPARAFCLLLFDMRRVRCLLVSFRLSPGSALKFQPSCPLSDKSLLTNDMSGICMKSVREKKKVLAGAKSAEYPSLVFVITMRVWSLPGKGRQEGTGKKNEFLSRASTSHSKKSLFVWERSRERWHSLFCFALAYRPYPVVS